MAEFGIRTVSGNKRSLNASIAEGRAVVHSVDSVKSHAIAEIAIRGYDASSDLLYSLPSGELMDRAKLEWELDLHVPPLLSIQTDEHWFGSSSAGFVMIQPIRISESVASPLESVIQLASALPGESILLQCDESSMLAVECLNQEVIIQSAGMSIGEYARMEPAARERVLSLRRDSHVILSGSEVTSEVFLQLRLWRFHSFELIGPQHLMACAEIMPAVLNTIAGHEGEYALLVGAASGFARQREPLLVIR